MDPKRKKEIYQQRMLWLHAVASNQIVNPAFLVAWIICSCQGGDTGYAQISAKALTRRTPGLTARTVYRHVKLLLEHHYLTKRASWNGANRYYLTIPQRLNELQSQYLKANPDSGKEVTVIEASLIYAGEFSPQPRIRLYPLTPMSLKSDKTRH